MPLAFARPLDLRCEACDWLVPNAASRTFDGHTETVAACPRHRPDRTSVSP